MFVLDISGNKAYFDAKGYIMSVITKIYGQCAPPSIVKE